MIKSTPIQSNSIRFSKWSRKSYAIFQSIGKQITIGCLTRNVVEPSLKKHKNNSVRHMKVLFANEEEENIIHRDKEFVMQWVFINLRNNLHIISNLKKDCNPYFYFFKNYKGGSFHEEDNLLFLYKNL